ncbi:MAG: hypothetical protein Q4G48_01190 [Bacteroidia bacterium]|nr:hypothetical protein [Bacteroidia bacterium]
MATTIVRINDRDKVGRYLLGVARELAKTSKDITIIEKSGISQDEEIAALAKKINNAGAKKWFAQKGMDYDSYCRQ